MSSQPSRIFNVTGRDVAFTAASIRGWRDYMEGDPSAANQLISTDNKQMLPEFIAFSTNAMKKYRLIAGDPARGETHGQINPARIAEEIHQLVEIGVLDSPLNVEDVLDESVVPPSVK